MRTEYCPWCNNASLKQPVLSPLIVRHRENDVELLCSRCGYSATYTFIEAKRAKLIK